MTLTRAIEYGIVCDSCHDEVNIHECSECGHRFRHGDVIHCIKNREGFDNSHYHEHCFKDEAKE